jgi:DNA-binding NtrC family response regulator
VGDTRTRRVDVRVAAATNVDLAGEVRAGRFREDLFYRLRVVGIRLPPLRERKEDLPLLAAHFLEHFNQAFHKNIQGFEPRVMDLFLRHPWPGNVRELKHAIEHACILCPGGEIGREHLPGEIVSRSAAAAVPGAGEAEAGCPEAGRPGAGHSETRRPRDVDQAAIREAIRRAGGNKSKAAKLLGMSRRTLYRRMAEEGVS